MIRDVYLRCHSLRLSLDALKSGSPEQRRRYSRLYALAQPLVSDFERFETLVGEEPSPKAPVR